MTKRSASHAGFSLTELLIVIAIVGILAAVGYPNYQNFVRESKRSDAHASLTKMATQQERFFADNQNTYSRTLTGLGYSDATPDSLEGYWEITLTNPNSPADTTQPATDFLLSAAANDHSDPGCDPITITSTGVMAPATCW